MKFLLDSFLICAALLLITFMVIAWAKGFTRPDIFSLANVAEGEHLDGKITYYADGVLATRFLLVKPGSVPANIAVAGAADEPKGIAYDSADNAGDPVSVQILGSAKGTQRGTALGVIPPDTNIYTAAGGTLQVEPTVAGTYYLVGRSLNQANTAAGDIFEFAPMKPIKVVVIAALTSVPNATAAAADLPTSEALANALKTNYNALQADVAALAGALATPALVKVI